MKYKGLWSRWHRFDSDGKKHIKKFGIDETPSPIQEEGYTCWVRGTGPLSEEHYKNVTTAVRKVCVGVPKTPEQKEKMRQAKLGKPKTLEHRQNMALAWKNKRKAKYQNAIKLLEEMKAQSNG